MEGHTTFNSRLAARLTRAPSDLMHFLEACAMGNTHRVEALLEKGVVSHQGFNLVMMMIFRGCEHHRNTAQS